MRTVDEIINGDALTWSTMDAETLRHEHEQLRRALETARQQIAMWSPLVAWRRFQDWGDVLAHNLAIAALGCASFEMGRAHAQFAEAYFEGNTDEGEEWPFEPGCGRSAP
jgi:hypothetical protein